MDENVCARVRACGRVCARARVCGYLCVRARVCACLCVLLLVRNTTICRVHKCLISNPTGIALCGIGLFARRGVAGLAVLLDELDHGEDVLGLVSVVDPQDGHRPREPRRRQPVDPAAGHPSGKWNTR